MFLSIAKQLWENGFISLATCCISNLPKMFLSNVAIVTPSLNPSLPVAFISMLTTFSFSTTASNSFSIVNRFPDYFLNCNRNNNLCDKPSRAIFLRISQNALFRWGLGFNQIGESCRTVYKDIVWFYCALTELRFYIAVPARGPHKRKIFLGKKASLIKVGYFLILKNHNGNSSNGYWFTKHECQKPARLNASHKILARILFSLFCRNGHQMHYHRCFDDTYPEPSHSCCSELMLKNCFRWVIVCVHSMDSNRMFLNFDYFWFFFGCVELLLSNLWMLCPI